MRLTPFQSDAKAPADDITEEDSLSSDDSKSEENEGDGKTNNIPSDGEEQESS